MKRSVIIILAMVITLHLCTGFMYGEGHGTLTYTNLVDEETRNGVKAALEEAGIARERTDTVFHLADDYNQVMGDLPDLELVSGFTTIDKLAPEHVDYGTVNFHWWHEKNKGHYDVLCRIVAYMLMQDHIKAVNRIDRDGWQANDGQWLLSDMDSIETNPMIGFSGGEISEYFTLFNPVTVSGNIEATPENICLEVQNEWADRGISFEKIPASLLTIWLYDENSGMTCAAHAGVLVEREDSLLFFEKTNPEEPYQASIFNGIEEVKEYIVARFETENRAYGMEMGTYFFMRNENMI